MREQIFKHIRAHYKTIKGYSSAGMEAGKSAGVIYLNANENPYELPNLEGLNRYPEPQPLALLEAYAQNYDIDNSQIVMTRGADEALVILTKVFCEPHEDQILISTPTFGMYAVDAHAMPAGVIDVPLIKEGGSFTLDKENIINTVLSYPHSAKQSNVAGIHKDSSKAADITDPVRANSATQNANGMTGRIKMVFICSPNNPTGQSASHEDIIDICEALEGHCVVILDEAYAEFSKAGSMSGDLDSTPNLIILRTLSKGYSLAGMRMGTILCGDEDFITLIRSKVMDAYPLPLMSIEAAFHVLSPEIKAIAQENIKKILAERERMEIELGKSDKVNYIYPSDTNFLLIEMDKAKEFCDYMAENNVIIRDFSSKAGTENCLRLSIGTKEENDRVLELLNKFQV